MQPPGPVIVLAHSMGGLLAADAATDPSNNEDHRIIGMVAFDTPYLGLHPHVVVSGIASLFRDDEDNKAKPTVKDMNEEQHVHMVDDAVTADWAAYKKGMPKHKSSTSLSSHSSNTHHHSPSPQPQSSSSQSLEPPSLSPAQLIGRTLSHPFITGPLKFLSAHTDDPVVRWARKHSDAPFAAGRKWIVEHFQFGSCMFDVPGLKERYARLVGWDGLWINYWTRVLPRKKGDGTLVIEDVDEHEERERANDVALMETGMTEPSSATPGQHPEPPPNTHTLGNRTHSGDKVAQVADAKAIRKSDESHRLKRDEAEQKAKKNISSRHFVVLPTGLGRVLGGGHKWEPVIIAGVQDEVAAHTGLFIRGQNLDYDGLVERVGQKVLGWCETLR